MENHHHTLTSENEKRTLAVIIFTLIAMAAEILYGYYTNSMALLADGYHMGTHALALSLTALTRGRRKARPQSSGTWNTAAEQRVVRICRESRLTVAGSCDNPRPAGRTGATIRRTFILWGYFRRRFRECWRYAV